MQWVAFLAAISKCCIVGISIVECSISIHIQSKPVFARISVTSGDRRVWIVPMSGFFSFSFCLKDMLAPASSSSVRLRLGLIGYVLKGYYIIL